MEKNILEQYSDARARLKLFKVRKDNNQKRLNKIDKAGYYVTDVVTYGRKGKKPLGVAIISGRPYPKADRLVRLIQRQETIIEQEEMELLELQTRAEEFIAGLEDIKMRNLLDLYYIEDLNWVQVAHWMNELYPKKKRAHTADSCRCRHDRFMGKFFKTTVPTVSA